MPHFKKIKDISTLELKLKNIGISKKKKEYILIFIVQYYQNHSILTYLKI